MRLATGLVVLAVGGAVAFPTTAHLITGAGATFPAHHALRAETGNYDAFAGRWVGVWDNNPRYTTSLTIETITPTGAMTGTYAFMHAAPAKVMVQIADDNTFQFGTIIIFKFRLRPDGKLEGTRNDGGVFNTTVLTRE